MRVEPNQTGRASSSRTPAEVRDLNELARSRLRSAGELGDDVAVTTERGERALASSDRVMFLKNERGMGVKNGTLATIQRVSPDRMAVRLDDGREVAFDVKDYAHVGHGYAATFHKAQGVTVEGAHVLATPGMDRHSAYVGLSRHHDDVQLQYGRDDFGDQERLVRTLSRERAKDMASDYSRDFAERCGIDATDRLDSAAVRDQIIQRHARTVSAIFQMQEQGRDLLPEQVPALQASRKELNKLDPHAAVDIERAYKADPPLAHEAAGGRAARAIRAMRL